MKNIKHRGQERIPTAMELEAVLVVADRNPSVIISISAVRKNRSKSLGPATHGDSSQEDTLHHQRKFIE